MNDARHCHSMCQPGGRCKVTGDPVPALSVEASAWVSLGEFRYAAQYGAAVSATCVACDAVVAVATGGVTVEEVTTACLQHRCPDHA